MALGSAPEDAARTIDAAGRVVSPGFVDIHTHYDAQIIWDQLVSCSPWHGVTTVVMGNCGFSVAPTRPDAPRPDHAHAGERRGHERRPRSGPGSAMDWPFETFPEYLDAVEDRGCAVNVAALVGHTALRMYVMGEDSVQREATADEVAAPARRSCARPSRPARSGSPRPRRITHVGYDGKPVPSRLATTEEIVAIAGALGEVPNAVMQATVGRGLSHQEFAQHRRAHRASRSAGRRCCRASPARTTATSCARRPRSAARGLHVFPQVAVQPVQFEMSWKAPFIYEALRCFNPVSQAPTSTAARPSTPIPTGGPSSRRRPATAARSVTAGRAPTISWYPTRPVASKAATCRSWPTPPGRDPVDVVLDLALDADLDMRITQDVINYNPDHIEELLKDPNDGDRAVRCRRPRQPAVRRQVLHRVPGHVRTGAQARSPSRTPCTC